MLLAQLPGPTERKRWLREPMVAPPQYTVEHRAIIAKANEHARAAAKLIAETGYHRRDRDGRLRSYDRAGRESECGSWCRRMS